MRAWISVFIGLGFVSLAQSQEPTGRAAALGTAVRQLSLDPDACYRIRDLQLKKDDARIYLTDGWLIFAKPVNGRHIGAVFTGTESGNDAEITLRPPDRSERASLASFTGSPNLSEHFNNAVFLFSDDSGEDLLNQIKSGVPKPSSEMGLVLSGKHNELVANLASSFQVRLVLDLLSPGKRPGMFFAALAGKTHGNFDFLFDPVMREQVILGRVATKNSVLGFEIWSSFETRASRQEGRRVKPEIKLERFTIDAKLEPDLALDAMTRIHIKALSPLEGALAFEIAPNMEMKSAKWNGVETELFRRESLRAGLMRGSRNEVFLVTVPGVVPPGTEFDLEFKHRGRVILPAGPKVYFVGSRMNWYPSCGDDFSEFDLTFRAPKDLQIVATGELREERDEGDLHVSHRRTSSPVRLAGFNLGAYEKVATKAGPYQVEVYANKSADTALQRRSPQVIMLPPQISARGARRPNDMVIMPAVSPDSSARLKLLATEIASGLEWMSGQFGPPPLKTITVSPIPGYFGQGFPGLIYLSTVSYLNPADRPASASSSLGLTFYDEILHSHELAHQWWGNLVTSPTYRDDWIQEALANYTALLLLERKKGSKALSGVLSDYLGNLKMKREEGKTVESAGPIAWGVRLHTETYPDPWRAIVYDKGSWILHMLRRRMGDAAFMKMMTAIRERYEYKQFSTEALQAAVAQFSPPGLPDEKLENFFDTWVHSTGIPTLQMTTKVQGKAPNVKLNITVRQSDVDEDFGVDVPVEIRMPGTAKPMVQWLRTSSEPVTLTVPLKTVPAKVELAPGSAVLAVIK